MNLKVKFYDESFINIYDFYVLKPGSSDHYSKIFSMDKEYEVHLIHSDEDGSTHAALVCDANFIIFVNCSHIQVVEEDGIRKDSISSTVKLTTKKINDLIR